MKKLIQILEWSIQKFIYVGGAIILLVMLYTTLNVILRVLGYPLPGDIEIIVTALVCIIYSTIAYCAVANNHIRIDLFKKWPWMDHVNNVIAFITGLVISIQAFKKVGTAARMHVTSTLLGIPRAPFLFIAAFGFLLFALAVVCVELRLILAIVEKRKQNNHPGPEMKEIHP
jgi:TRAP-type C4-dicarboxylate transport system permease small subunit